VDLACGLGVATRVDPLLPRAEKRVLVLEAIGDDKVRINSTSLYNPLVVLAYEALEVVAIEKQLHVCRAPRHAEYLKSSQPGSRARVTVRQWKRATEVDR
jgi:hypothetical protein